MANNNNNNNQNNNNNNDNKKVKKAKYKVLRTISIGGNIVPAGKTVDIDPELAKAFGKDFVQPAK